MGYIQKKYLLELTKESCLRPGAEEILKLLKNEKNELIVISARGIEFEEMVTLVQEKINEYKIEFDKYYWKCPNKLEICLNENIGSGVLRILDAYDKSCFIFMDHFLRVSFRYRDNPFEYDQKTTQETTQENFAMLNETQQNIIKLIKNNPSITQKELAKELKITRDGVKYNISVLKEMNIIIREGSTKKGNWKILK